MARHRNYRNYAYEDDMSDDVYGHSVEDYDMAVSPTTAEQFMFRRSNSQDPNLSAYMADRFGRVDEEDEEEEDEDEPLNSSQVDYRRPQLDPISEAKLSSCLDQLHSIMGENLHEPMAVSAVIQCNYDVERALDQIFSQGEKQDSKKANSGPFGTEGFVSCKTQLFANIEQGEIVQYENNIKVNSASKDDENLKVTAGQPFKSLIVRPSANASDKSSVSHLLTQGNSFLQSGGPVSGKSVASHPLDLLQVSTHIAQTLSSLGTTSQSAEASSGQPVRSQPLDLLQSSAHNTLMSAPLSSLSQLGHSTSSQSAMSQAHELLTAPLSSFSQRSQSSVSQPLDLLPASSQNTLLSAPLSSLPQLGGSSCAPPRKTGFLDLVQASSQNTLLATPLSSLPGGSLSCQSATPWSLDALEASPQKSLVSAPLSSFSQSGESLSGHPMTSQPPGFSQSSSQRTKLSAPRSSMVPSGGSLSSELQPMDLSQMSPQNTLRSTSLSSLTKSEGTLSGFPVTSQPLDVLQPFHNPLLSVPLSSLSAHPTTRPQKSSLPLGSLSQLSFQQGNSVTGIPHSTSKSPLLQTMSSHTLLSTPLSRLSQTPFATVVCEPTQEPSLSTPLGSLSQTGHSVQSSLPLTTSGQCGNTEPLPMEEVVDDTVDVTYLAEKLKNVHIPGSSSTLSTGKKDYNQNIQDKHKHSTSGTASTVELSVDQKEMKSEHFSIKKKVFASKQKRQMSSRWSDTQRLTAKPTLFGLAVCYSSSVENASTKVVVQRVVNELHNSDCLRITAFDFSTPSPDDIVKDKQKGAFSRKK